MFKWACLAVAVIALSAFGWMLNDIRLQVRATAEKANTLADKADGALAKVDAHLPAILAQAEKAGKQLDNHLPRILIETEAAGKSISTHLPRVLIQTEATLDNVADLSDEFKQYKSLMGVVHAASQSKSLFSYGGSILGWLGGREDATIGVKKAGGEQLAAAVPAKEWAASAKRDVHFLSLVAQSKEEVLHGLSRSKTPKALHIQVGKEPPRPLADWLRETHAESKGVK
jgi:hypothetical protein